MGERCDRCSGCGEAVPISLVRHQLRTPWGRELEQRDFSFCPTPGCDVVYFTEDGTVFGTRDVRHPPAYKTGDPADVLCFCFDASGAALLDSLDPVPYIRERVRKGECACDLLNPSGACCLGSVGRWRKERDVPQ